MTWIYTFIIINTCYLNVKYLKIKHVILSIRLPCRYNQGVKWHRFLIWRTSKLKLYSMNVVRMIYTQIKYTYRWKQPHLLSFCDAHFKVNKSFSIFKFQFFSSKKIENHLACSLFIITKSHGIYIDINLTNICLSMGPCNISHVVCHVVMFGWPVNNQNP